LNFQNTSDKALCKAFPLTIKGNARAWFAKLSRNSVSSFDDLSRKFLRYFSVSKKINRTTGSLFYIVQETLESLREYYMRFNKATLEIESLQMEVASEAFRQGVQYVDLQKELDREKPQTYKDTVKIVTKFLNQEEGEQARATRIQGSSNRLRESHPSSKREMKSRRILPSKLREDSPPPRRYTSFTPLNTSRAAILAEIQDTVKLKWPTQMKGDPAKRDKTKFYAFHSDYGHLTRDCIALKYQIEDLIRQGCLANFVQGRASDNRPRRPLQERLAPPTGDLKQARDLPE
ncbi:retrotransposon gag domain-containing protein, partial [Staphylococcus aureus]|nr:retrotransposon gag domain-containing protein [Staphylococcus aureus]